MTTIRHGDVVLSKVDLTNIPEGFALKPIDPRGTVLAEGEATGHAHTIADPSAAMLFGNPGTDWSILKVMMPVPLTHQEHQDVILDPGTYRVSIKREYTDDEKGWKEVID